MSVGDNQRPDVRMDFAEGFDFGRVHDHKGGRQGVGDSG